MQLTAFLIIDENTHRELASLRFAMSGKDPLTGETCKDCPEIQT